MVFLHHGGWRHPQTGRARKREVGVFTRPVRRQRLAGLLTFAGPAPQPVPAAVRRWKQLKGATGVTVEAVAGARPAPLLRAVNTGPKDLTRLEVGLAQEAGTIAAGRRLPNSARVITNGCSARWSGADPMNQG